MIKIITIISMMIGVYSIYSRINNESNLYTPKYKIISKNNNIEIRQYNNINIISTIEQLPYKEATYNGFKTLANYIFGNNKDNIKIPMTAPVLTSFPNKKKLQISFIIDEQYSIDKLPQPKSEKIIMKELKLNKVAAIKFGFWATNKKVNKIKKKLETYLNKNNFKYSSEFLIAQYNSPWIIPPFRKNEILVNIIDNKGNK